MTEREKAFFICGMQFGLSRGLERLRHDEEKHRQFISEFMDLWEISEEFLNAITDETADLQNLIPGYRNPS